MAAHDLILCQIPVAYRASLVVNTNGQAFTIKLLDLMLQASNYPLAGKLKTEKGVRSTSAMGRVIFGNPVG